MQRTGATFTRIEQTGPTVDALQTIVPHINVPDGFEVSLYAVVPDARSMAVAPQGTVVFVGTRKDKVWSVVDRDRDRVADEVMDFAPWPDLRHSERPLLLARRVPVHRRAQPRPGLPGRRVLL